MFGLSTTWIKVLVFVTVLSTISAVTYAGYSFVTDLQDEISVLTTNNATLTSNNQQLQQGITEQQDTITNLQADITLQADIFNDTNQQFAAARGQVSDLRSRLSRHELGYLAANRPGLVTGIINTATANGGRCLEIAAGSPLTSQEINATLPSEINGECPQLANPNYRGQ